MDVGSENIGLAEARRWRRLERRASPSSKTKLEYELGFTPGDRPRDDGSWMRCAPLRVLSILVVIVWGEQGRPARRLSLERLPYSIMSSGTPCTLRLCLRDAPGSTPRRTLGHRGRPRWTRAPQLRHLGASRSPREHFIGARTHEGSVRARTRDRCAHARGQPRTATFPSPTAQTLADCSCHATVRKTPTIERSGGTPPEWASIHHSPPIGARTADA